jgi:hypothetical protein
MTDENEDRVLGTLRRNGGMMPLDALAEVATQNHFTPDEDSFLNLLLTMHDKCLIEARWALGFKLPDGYREGKMVEAEPLRVVRLTLAGAAQAVMVTRLSPDSLPVCPLDG